ncbi:MAG: hypothetical protein NC453_18855 [Muribaculum sp.]|nr:hypothetical protein [Muribaculum sp.]
MYLSAIAIDFGSSNSGAARIDTIKDGHLVYSTPEFCHSDGYYAKDPTWFWISPELLAKAISNYSELKDSDFRILSRNFQSTENPNLVWGTDFFTKDGPSNINLLSSKGWVEFKYFKMMIYLDVPYVSNNREYPIELVVKIFLRVIKIECLARESTSRQRKVDSTEIQWGVTVPSIWTSQNKELMTCICSEVFGSHVRILSEPEGPVISERIHAGLGNLSLKKGTKSLVIDIGGGTTDICLLEDNDDKEEVKFKQLASCDGIGVGGNIIDADFRHYIVHFFSKGLKDDSGVLYDTMNEHERYSKLYSSFTKDPVNNLLMERAWLLYKHHVTPDYQIPRQYIKWLDQNGHGEVADRVRDFMFGDITFDDEKFNQYVYLPSFSKICSCVEDFVANNVSHFNCSSTPINIVFAGGLSLLQPLRDRIISVVNKAVGRILPSNLSNTTLLASGSIMDGATYILLYKKSISRISPFYIYNPIGNASLHGLKMSYSDFGIDIKLGELNTISETDLTERNATACNVLGVPVAVKGQPFKDYKASYTAIGENQTAIRIDFVGSEDLIVHPIGNKACWQLVDEKFANKKGYVFSCIIDLNESNSGNLHYYIKNENSGEEREGNIIIKLPN